MVRRPIPHPAKLRCPAIGDGGERRVKIAPLGTGSSSIFLHRRWNAAAIPAAGVPPPKACDGARQSLVQLCWKQALAAVTRRGAGRGRDSRRHRRRPAADLGARRGCSRCAPASRPPRARSAARAMMVPHRGQSWALRSLGNFAVSRLRLVGSGLADCGDGSQEAFHCSTDRGVRN